MWSSGAPKFVRRPFKTISAFGEFRATEVCVAVASLGGIAGGRAWPHPDRKRAIGLQPDMIFASGTGALNTHKAEMFNLDFGCVS